MNFKTFLKFSKIQYATGPLTTSYITRNETDLLRTGPGMWSTFIPTYVYWTAFKL